MSVLFWITNKEFMSKQLYTILLLFFIAVSASAGKPVKGHVYDEQNEPVIGSNIYWEGTQLGTTSDADGYFELEKMMIRRIWLSVISAIRRRLSR